jgi:hypothetical protein
MKTAIHRKILAIAAAAMIGMAATGDAALARGGGGFGGGHIGGFGGAHMGVVGGPRVGNFGVGPWVASRPPDGYAWLGDGSWPRR